MDQSEEIYANVERPLDCHNKWKRQRESSKHIYENEKKFPALEPNRSGPAALGNEHDTTTDTQVSSNILYMQTHTNTKKCDVKYNKAKSRKNTIRK